MQAGEALGLLLAGFLTGICVCACIWLDSEAAERRYRINVARYRDHAKVPAMTWRSR
jgi:hypothetical protein